jgi:serine phosphatase RsbU (regulator of sigma subunit)
MRFSFRYYFWLFISLGLITSACKFTTNYPIAKQGRIDLSMLDFSQVNAVKLEGEWIFYWQQLLQPVTIDSLGKKPQFVKIPTSWTNYSSENGVKLPTYGYGTYRVQIKLPKNIPAFGLAIPKIWSANRVWVNGREISQRGKVTLQYEGYENQILENFVMVSTETPEMDIIVQVANHDFFIAGLVQNFQIGAYQQIFEGKELQNAWDLMWLGCLFLMGAYHFILFGYRPKNLSTLWFGAACWLIAIRLVVFGEHFLYAYLKEHWGFLNFLIQGKVYYVTSFALIPIALWYMHALYPMESKRRIVWLCTYWSIAICTFVVIAPPRLYLAAIGTFEVVTLLFEFYLIYVLFLATWRKCPDAWLQSAGIVLMVLASINDALHSEGLELAGDLELAPTAFAFFLGLQIFVIARRFSRAFNEVEDLSENLELKVTRRTEELNAQKLLIEHKNEEITASITYAQRIQQAILPSTESINQILPENFILYRPRDIVSGDFFWFNVVATKPNLGGKVFLAAVDCTGHGVPGAFMSMIGSSFLDEIVNEKRIYEADLILRELHLSIRRALRQTETNNRDGMDIALVVIDQEYKYLEYAGAKNPLIYIQGQGLQVLKADKMPIGGVQLEMERYFTKHRVALDTPAVFYLFSDGFQDQFGGRGRKKFGIKRLKETLLQLQHLPLKAQGEFLDGCITQWMTEGNERQIDDILVIGFKI